MIKRILLAVSQPRVLTRVSMVGAIVKRPRTVLRQLKHAVIMRAVNGLR